MSDRLTVNPVWRAPWWTTYTVVTGPAGWKWEEGAAAQPARKSAAIETRPRDCIQMFLRLRIDFNASRTTTCWIEHATRHSPAFYDKNRKKPFAEAHDRVHRGRFRAQDYSSTHCLFGLRPHLSGPIDARPKTALAKQAGDELVRDYGFKKLPIRDPFAAPLGSVLVYTARGAAGHVEIRTKNGFVSDFTSKTPSKRPLLGVYAKG